jgi:hypothetical protein
LRPTWDSTGAISFDLVDDYLFSTMEASLGSTSDVFYITAQGVIELYNQTVSSNWVIPNDEKFYQCVVTPSPLSGSNRAALRNWMKQKTGISAAKPFLVMYGDSMTYGTGATTWSTDTWWRRLAIARDYIPINRGVGGETSTQIKTRFLAQIANGNWYSDPRTIYTIWAGRNNFGSPATVLADIAAMVAALPAGARYLVISVLNGEAVAEYSGGADYINIVTNINAVLASTYGANYVDLRAYLVSQYDPGTPQDVTDFGHDITPSTLRNGAIHQNNAGHIKTQGYLASILDAKGW